MVGGEQHVFIVRHGDKYSSYPDCPSEDEPVAEGLCFNRELMGNNVPLTPCGVQQGAPASPAPPPPHLRSAAAPSCLSAQRR